MPPTSAERKSRLPITRWHLLGVLGGAFFGLAACGGGPEAPLSTGIPFPAGTLVPAGIPEVPVFTIEKVSEVLRIAETLWPTIGISVFMGLANAAAARRGWRQEEAVAKFQAEAATKSIDNIQPKLQRAFEKSGSNQAGGILAAFGAGNGAEEAVYMDFTQLSAEMDKLSQAKAMLNHWKNKAKAAGGIGVAIRGHQIGLPSRTVAIDVAKEGLEGTLATFYGFQVALPSANQFLSSLAAVEADPAKTILLGAKAAAEILIGGWFTFIAWKKQGGKEML